MILGKSVDVKSRVKFSMQISGSCNVSRFLQLCDGIPDSQEHVPLCSGLNRQFNVNYKDLFSLDLDKVKDALIGFENAWSQRIKNV